MFENDRTEAEVPQWRKQYAAYFSKNAECTNLDLFFAMNFLCDKVEELELKVKQLGKEQ